MKPEAWRWHNRRVLRASLGAWLLRARQKQALALLRRRAVRHAYLAALARPLRAWQALAAAAGLERRLEAAACSQRDAQLRRRAMQVGRGGA